MFDLEINNLLVKRGKGEQAHSVTLHRLAMNKGEIIAITGASGCGKSTLLESIGLLLEPESIDKYQLRQNNSKTIDLSNWQLKKEAEIASLRSQQIGFMLQSGGLIPYINVKENIYLPRQILKKSDKDSYIEQAIKKLGLSHVLNKYPSQLSIGERQRVAFIRAIAHEPDLLLADEPTAALDPIYAKELISLFIDVVQKIGICALIVSHDWDLIKSFDIKKIEGKTRPKGCDFV